MDLPQETPRRSKRSRLDTDSANDGSGIQHPSPVPIVNAYQPTPPESFWPLTPYFVPPGGPVSALAREPAIPPASTMEGSANAEGTPATDYDHAIARIQALSSHLTAGMRSSLTSLLSVLHTHLSTTTPHPLVHRVASPDTPDQVLRGWADTIDRGLHAFAARGGRPASSASPSVSSRSVSKRSSTRSEKVHRDCAERDHRTCILSGKQRGGGVVAHILPFSMQQSKAADFWEFVALFRGKDETEELKMLALGSKNDTDTLTNVFWLMEEPHSYFDKGWLAIIPQLTQSQLPYDPGVVSEYDACVEFPFGTLKADVPVLKYVDGIAEFSKMLRPGDIIQFTTSNPARLPLPHPLVFQLHAVVSRVMAIKTATGYPVFANEGDWESDEEWLVHNSEGLEHSEESQQEAYDNWSEVDGVHCRPGNDHDTGTHIVPLSSISPHRYVEHWLYQPGFSDLSRSPPPPDYKDKRCDNKCGSNEADDILGNVSSVEKSRKVEVVEAEEKMRTGERWRMLMERGYNLKTG